MAATVAVSAVVAAAAGGGPTGAGGEGQLRPLDRDEVTPAAPATAENPEPAALMPAKVEARTHV